MYRAPTTSMGRRIRGIRAPSAPQKRAHSSMTAEKPTQMPRLKGIAFRKPFWLALDMDMMLLGPGVTAVTTA